MRRMLRLIQGVLALAGVVLVGQALTAVVGARVYQAREASRFEKVLSERSAVEPRDAGDPGVLGRIEIPRLDVSAIVREGTDEESLELAVGHIAGTARPGESGNVGLAGHRDSFFRPLRGVRVGDEILLRTTAGQRTYRVDDIRIVSPDEVGVLAPSREARLTLVTCYPFSYIGRAPRRYVVGASLVGSGERAAEIVAERSKRGRGR